MAWHMDSSGQICYRISARNGRLYQFVLHSASQNLYPTPVIRYMSRCPAPSGHEEKIKLDVKKKLAGRFAVYNEAYFTAFTAVKQYCSSNLVYPLLKENRKN